MKNTIYEYQKAFNEIGNKFRVNKNIIAMFTFGSMVSGDIWEESDIDIFIVYKDDFKNVRDIYTESLDIPVHIKILGKNEFLDSYRNEDTKGIARNILNKSKLVFSKDIEITDAYNSARYTSNNYVARENLEYLSQLLKEIGICKKYLHNGGIFTAFEVLIRSLNSFAKLYMNLNGYTLTKDSIKTVMNLESTFERMIENLMDNCITEEEILKVINYIEEYIDNNLINSSKIVLKIIRDNDRFMSSCEISNDELLKGSNVKLENILKILEKRDIIIKRQENVLDKNGKVVIVENVYGFK